MGLSNDPTRLAELDTLSRELLALRGTFPAAFEIHFNPGTMTHILDNMQGMIDTIRDHGRAAVEPADGVVPPWKPLSHWGSHPDYTPSDWRYEVLVGDTRLSYTQWVNKNLENAWREANEN